jgi:hypothetical protein
MTLANEIPERPVQQGSARYLYLPAMVAAMGGLVFGIDTEVIS